MPPTMPTVSALAAASAGLSSSDSAIAVPAALSTAVSSSPIPIATSQPKKLAPQLIPP